MGNKVNKQQTELVSSHPNFKNARMITEKDHRLIRTSLPSDGEGYDAWKNFLNRDIKKLENTEFLLIPKRHTLNKDNFCTHTGNVEVYFLLKVDRL